MDTWHVESTSFSNYPQECGPFYREVQGPMYHQLDGPLMYTMPEPTIHEAHYQCIPREEVSRTKLEKRRERNRQASARYRERKEQLLADLETDTKRMAQEVAHLEARLRRGQEELARLRRGQEEVARVRRGQEEVARLRRGQEEVARLRRGQEEVPRTKATVSNGYTLDMENGNVYADL